MHNNIMAAGSKDRPPMLGPGRYSQWRSRFLRYIDTKPNGEGLRKSILSGPYVPSTVLVQAVAATEGNPAIQQHTTIETVLNMTPENKEHFLSEKEAIFLLLTGIGDDIYSTVDACKTANEMWIAIERLQQGESLNVQDVKTNLFWEFGKFTSRDGESMESYYSRFYKLMNELTRNNLQVTTMQVNVQFLQQLQPEWSRFVTVVKQSKEIDTISYHTLFDILKQYQNEVNDIRAERIAKISEEDSDPEQAQRDKDMQKNLALLTKYFKKLYKPTNNNLRTSSNFRNKTEDTTTRYNNDNQSGQFGNQRTMTVAGARETECRKPKRVKDYSYHKEKMMMCKQVEQGVSLQAKQADWLANTDEEINEQELEAHYSFMAKIQEVLLEESSSTEQPLEQASGRATMGIQCFNCNGFGQYEKECRKPKRVKTTQIDERIGTANSSSWQKIFAPDREETMTLDNESRSKLNKDYVKPYDYTKQNSLYEIFKAPSLEYLYQLERAKEVRKTMWRKPFVRTKPNIAKNVAFLPVSKSISKSRQVFNDMTFNINQFIEIVDQTWRKHTSSCFRVPTAHDMELLIKTFLMPLSIKSQNDSFRFEHELKTEMHEDFEYVKSLENEVDELESEKADFSNMYDLLIEECVSKDVTCSYLHSLSDLNAHTELQCLYLHKVKECECLAQKLSKQTESVNN
ncbi:retrovirus-related pol polyprotein from transposon TNT 1-94, partial [Tanacetum coccineum]